MVTATKAIQKNLKDYSAFEEDFIALYFIATVDQVKSLPRNQNFLVVRKWRDHPDAEQILEAMKDCDWESVFLKDLLLS